MKKYVLLSVFGLCIFIVGFVQFRYGTIIGADGHLHARMAYLIRENGMLKSLPQAHFSWFVTRFVDRDYVYHLLMIPFVTIFGYIPGAKITAFIFFLLVCFVVFWILLKETRYPFALIGMILLLFSHRFLIDMSRPRPYVLALVCALFGIYALAKKKPIFFFIITFCYGAVHISAWTLPVFAIILYMYQRIEGHDMSCIFFALSLAGYILSLVIHPYFPDNLFYTRLVGVEIPWTVLKGGVLESGAEFFPLDTRELVVAFPVLLYAVLFAVFSSAFTKIIQKQSTKIWGISWIFFLIMGLISKRHLSYMYPLFIIWFVLFLFDTKNSWKSLRKDLFGRMMPLLTIGTIFYVIIFGVLTVREVRFSLYSNYLQGMHFENIGSNINRQVPKGQRIFHANWSDSQFFIGLAPDYEYIVTLDPMYMYSFDKDLYFLYRSVSYGENKDPYTTISDNFGASYVYAGKNYFQPFIQQMKSDSRFLLLTEDDWGALFELSH